MLNKLLFKLFGLLDTIKVFLFQWGLKILLVIFICVILHNVVKMSELSSRYTGEYKKLRPIYDTSDESKYMNFYQIGSGDKTIIILSNFGNSSPVIQYQALAKSLASDYRVIIVEYFGYGFGMSMGSKHERTNENFAKEINTLLDFENIPGPYVLLADGTSNLYAIEYQKLYPEKVCSIISVDGLYPSLINNSDYKEYMDAYVTNINITSIFELTGYERVMSYVKPDTFYINLLQEKYPEIISSNEIAIYRNRIGSQYLSWTMIREANKLEDNMTELSDYKYPDYLPVLEIISTSKSIEYNDLKKKYDKMDDLEEVAKSMLVDGSMQHNVELVETSKDSMITDAYTISNMVKTFLQNH